jgi:hypothetical protein
MYRLLVPVFRLVKRRPKLVLIGLLALLLIVPLGGIISAKIYQNWDNEPDRGARAISGGQFGETYQTPEYLGQGWDATDSLWFYNTTQGSALLPYDFLLALEQPTNKKRFNCKRNNENAAWFLCPKNVDWFRYLPQNKTYFNPDALPVGFVKEIYEDKDYVGYTCAACHTAQINFKNPEAQKSRALRIDGGPAMADMVGFLTDLTKAMKDTLPDPEKDKNQRFDDFVARVVALKNNYKSTTKNNKKIRAEIAADLQKWTDARELYNLVNRSTHKGRRVEYGYARLDAFGRIYNRVIQHAINREQVAKTLGLVTVKKNGVSENLLAPEEIEEVLRNVGKPGDIVLRDDEFWKIIENLQSDKPGFPELGLKNMLRVRNAIFNSPNAPVSYPFLWDITHSDYVQWNSLASNASGGALGRNAGEVMGVFAILDWRKDTRWLTQLTGISLSAWLSDQGKKKEQIHFKSSIDLFNLQQLESRLGKLKSPQWPFCRNGAGGYYLPTEPADLPVDQRGCKSGDKKFDDKSKARGRLIYVDKCQRCHDVIDRDAWDRLVVGKLVGIEHPQSTDTAMAKNNVQYAGKSGNFKDTYQTVDVGKVVVREDAPVVQILTAATRGIIGTSDDDKGILRRGVEYIYTLIMAFTDNRIKPSVKAGTYNPDTTAKPYDSLLAYRARSLNGIWATAPYLHNGSVPTLYDLLLPVTAHPYKCEKERPMSFQLGSRIFDPKNVGFKSDGYEGFKFDTSIPGNRNIGHEYGACEMSDEQRWDLIEYLKSL